MTTSPYYRPPTYEPAQFASMTAADPALPVVVIGAGPVGMAVALGLAQRGIAVTVLEAANQVSFGSRAICVSRHSLEVADRLGFGEALSEIVLPWDGGRSFDRDEEVLHFRMPNEPHAVRGPMVNVSQSELEQVMADALTTHPLVSLYWGAGISGYTAEGAEVSLEVDTAHGTRQLRAGWVVAADGGRSRMRELAGIQLQGTSYEGRYVIADIHWRSDLPTERMVWFDPPSNPGSTVIMHRQPNDIWRIDYQLDPGEDAEVETQEHRIRARIASHLRWLRNERPWSLEWHGFTQRPSSSDRGTPTSAALADEFAGPAGSACLWARPSANCAAGQDSGRRAALDRCRCSTSCEGGWETVCPVPPTAASSTATTVSTAVS
jgi:3-(3-hydroxy-phenyl)propionate hydroxylase